MVESSKQIDEQPASDIRQNVDGFNISSTSRAIGVRVRAIRQQKRVTLGHVVDRAGGTLYVSSLSKLEKGEREWSAGHIEAVAAALGVSPRELLPGDDEDELDVDDQVDQVNGARRARGDGATRVVAGDDEPRRANPGMPAGQWLSPREVLLLEALRKGDLADALHQLAGFVPSSASSPAPSAGAPPPAPPSSSSASSPASPSAAASAPVDQVDLQAPLPSPSEPPVEAPAPRPSRAQRAKKGP